MHAHMHTVLGITGWVLMTQPQIKIRGLGDIKKIDEEFETTLPNTVVLLGGVLIREERILCEERLWL